jgi:hypothetical protein
MWPMRRDIADLCYSHEPDTADTKPSSGASGNMTLPLYQESAPIPV